jgi:hypothetical protein
MKSESLTPQSRRKEHFKSALFGAATQGTPVEFHDVSGEYIASIFWAEK